MHACMCVCAHVCVCVCHAPPRMRVPAKRSHMSLLETHRHLGVLATLFVSGILGVPQLLHWSARSLSPRTHALFIVALSITQFSLVVQAAHPSTPIADLVSGAYACAHVFVFAFHSAGLIAKEGGGGACVQWGACCYGRSCLPSVCACAPAATRTTARLHAFWSSSISLLLLRQSRSVSRDIGRWSWSSH